MLSGFNVNAIAVEVPIAFLTSDGKGPKDMGSQPGDVLRFTSRRRMSVLRENGGIDASGPWVQVQRLANPLVNELIIGRRTSDRWNAPIPPMSGVSWTTSATRAWPSPSTPCWGCPCRPRRDDLVNVLLKYGPDDRRLSSCCAAT